MSPLDLNRITDELSDCLTVRPARKSTLNRVLDLAHAIDADMRQVIEASSRADMEPPPEVLAVRHLVEAVVRVLRNHPGVAEAIEADVVAAADVLVREDA